VTSRLLAAAVVPLLAVALVGGGCRERQTSAAATAPPLEPAAASGAPGAASGAKASGASSTYALVYERVVGGNQDLYMVPAGGGVERRLTDDPALDGLPRWTADGRRVLFTSERTGKPQIYELTVDGGKLRRVRENDFVEYQVDESDDGKRLAFLSNAEGAEHLWVWTYAFGDPRPIVRHGRDSILGNPDWSPDASQIVFSSNWRIGHQIYVADAASGEARRISPLTSGGCEPRFSPDGRKVVYVSRGHLGDKSRLVEHDLSSGDEKVLVDWPALNYDPTYSPDGSELAFASNVSGEYVIYRQRLSDGKAWRVTFGPGGARYPDYRATTPAR
jgi:Tol biopolymer transport system component